MHVALCLLSLAVTRDCMTYFHCSSKIGFDFLRVNYIFKKSDNENPNLLFLFRGLSNTLKKKNKLWVTMLIIFQEG